MRRRGTAAPAALALLCFLGAVRAGAQTPTPVPVLCSYGSFTLTCAQVASAAACTALRGTVVTSCPTPSTSTPTATPTPTSAQKYCHKNSGSCFPWPPVIGLPCDALGDVINTVACAVDTPTPTPTGTPGPVTPTPSATATPSGPQPVGRDTFGVSTCFHDESGKPITSGAPGFWYCPTVGFSPWLIASSVEPDDNTTPGIGTKVPLGYSTKAIVSQPYGAYGMWQMSLSVDTINNPCPVTCAGWLWGFVGDDDPGDQPVSDDLTAYLNASWRPHGPGMARFIAQFTFQDPKSQQWAELDVNLGMTQNWPHWASATPPGYVSVAPVGAYSAIGMLYYVVFDGPALGFVDALTHVGVPVWRIPVSALVRKARLDYPTQFAVGEDWTLSAFGIAREQNGEEQQDIWIQSPPRMWTHGPQAMPVAP